MTSLTVGRDFINCMCVGISYTGLADVIEAEYGLLRAISVQQCSRWRLIGRQLRHYRHTQPGKSVVLKQLCIINLYMRFYCKFVYGDPAGVVAYADAVKIFQIQFCNNSLHVHETFENGMSILAMIFFENFNNSYRQL